jgi:hypothetical protein
MDTVEAGWTERHDRERWGPMDEKHHLAKVRVAGSNPVFRSIVAGQRAFFYPGRAADRRRGDAAFVWAGHSLETSGGVVTYQTRSWPGAWGRHLDDARLRPDEDSAGSVVARCIMLVHTQGPGGSSEEHDAGTPTKTR